jgi:DNA polymerase-3 subunit epsilon
MRQTERGQSVFNWLKRLFKPFLAAREVPSLPLKDPEIVSTARPSQVTPRDSTAPPSTALVPAPIGTFKKNTSTELSPPSTKDSKQHFEHAQLATDMAESSLLVTPSWVSRLPQKILFIDVETTGLSAEDRLVSFAGILLETRTLAQLEIKVKQTHLVFNPELPCHPRASAVHGYDDWTLSHQPTFEEHAGVIRDLISEADLMVAHNATFDMRFIRNEFTRIKRKLPNRPVYCTMQEWRMMGTGGSAKLNVVAAQFGHTRASQRHGALEDAWLAMAVYLGINTPVCIPPFDAVLRKVPVNLRPAPSKTYDWPFQDADKRISQPIGGERRELQRQRGPWTCRVFVPLRLLV